MRLIPRPRNLHPRVGNAGRTTSGLGSGGVRGFTPYVPPKPPPGSYDPALDAQLGSAHRGLGYLQQDTATADLRAKDDYGFALNDLDTAKTRAGEDYGTAIQALQRSYDQLQRRQGEGLRHNGVMSGGIALQAAAKRAENQALDRAPIDTSFKRFGDDNTLARGRLDIGYQRDWNDRHTALDRGVDEDRQFGLDTDKVKAFQATQSGLWEPPGRGEPGGMPRGEVVAHGQHFRDVVQGNMIVRYDQFGRVVSRRARSGQSKAW